MSGTPFSDEDARVMACVRDGESPRPEMNVWEYAQIIKSLFDRGLLSAQGITEKGTLALAEREGEQPERQWFEVVTFTRITQHRRRTYARCKAPNGSVFTFIAHIRTWEYRGARPRRYFHDQIETAHQQLYDLTQSLQAPNL